MVNCSNSVVVALAATAAAIAIVSPQSVEAATLREGWYYAIDTFDDGVTDGLVGGGAFEFYGLAIKANTETLTIALNANLPLSGYASNTAADGMIHWGDLFFNFSGQDFATAAATGDLFGIRFNADNDSGISGTGVFQGVVPTSVTTLNAGFASLSQYREAVTSQGGTPAFGDLPGNTDYFDPDSVPLNAIASGDKIGDLFWNPDVAGLDFASFGAVGHETIAFSIERSLFPEGSFIAHVLAECANDGIALSASLPPFASQPKGVDTSVPEPTSGWGLIGLALWVGTRGRWQRKGNLPVLNQP